MPAKKHTHDGILPDNSLPNPIKTIRWGIKVHMNPVRVIFECKDTVKRVYLPHWD